MTSQSTSSFYFERKRGFTLIEVLVVIALMSVLTTVSLTSMNNVVDDARFSQTSREIEQIRNALVGETQRLETGLRKNYGFLGDVGTLPTGAQGLSVLFTESDAIAAGLSLWTVHSSYGIGSGWKGPYISNTPGQNFLFDAWGNAYVYESPTAITGVAATLTSYGADGVAGGDGFNQDIVVNIPTDVVTGRLLGYVVTAQGDVTGADQVPYSGNAYIELYTADGSGGISTQSISISVGNSGRYSFTGVPLGVGALKVYIPNSGTPTQTVGPSIVELNKATTAAVPLARDPSTIYGTTSACPTDDYTVTSMSLDSVARTTAFRVSFSSNFTWSSNFYHEHQANASISRFTISNIAAATISEFYSSTTGIKSSTTGGVISAGVNHNFSTAQVLSSGQHDFKFYYNPTGWTASSASYLPVFYYRIGCKFFKLRPE